MAENTAVRKIRHRGRLEQVGIYFTKLLILFVYQNDWKLLPMSVVIAGLVSLVVKRDFFVTMEGTLKGALALSCVAIWNGFFNSIQVICREREIIKREHRSGMHISSYIVSHMMYQAILCAVQSALTIYTCKMMGIRFPKEGLFSSWMMFDIGVTVFLISYSADMISLWISTLVHNTTTAMSIMPFLLIAQLVFSGGIFTLPAWSNSISRFMISHYGVRCIAAQADYNHLPTVTAWNTLVKMEDNEIGGIYTIGEILEMAENRELPKVLEKYPDLKEDDVRTLVQALAEVPEIKTLMEKEVTIRFKVRDVIDFIGREELKEYLQYKTAEVAQKPEYEGSKANIASMWISFLMFIIAFSSLSIICLEFIDRDKR